MPTHVSERLAAQLLGLSPAAVHQLVISGQLRNEAGGSERRVWAQIPMAAIERRLRRPVTADEYMAAKERLMRNEGRRILCSTAA